MQDSFLNKTEHEMLWSSFISRKNRVLHIEKIHLLDHFLLESVSNGNECDQLVLADTLIQ
jgi:hypothetical protein